MSGPFDKKPFWFWWLSPKCQGCGCKLGYASKVLKIAACHSCLESFAKSLIGLSRDFVLNEQEKGK